jgi:hypothetical protein
LIRLIDDQGLSAVLRDGVPSDAGVDLFTTGCWYVRLCQAVLGASDRPGVLSGPFEGLPSSLRSRAVRSVIELPDTIGLLSLRELAPRMGTLRKDHDLNLLALEALAAASELRATVQLSTSSPLLEAALDREGLDVELVVPGSRNRPPRSRRPPR